MISSDLGVPRRLAVRGAIVIAVIALTGCGSSSSSSTNKTTTASTAAATTPTTTTPPAAPAPDKAADERVARNAQLRLADFPAGWEESDKVSATNQAPCQAINEAKAATNARDKSREFSKGGDNAESAAYIYADTATASHWLAELSSSATRSCLGDALGRELASEVKGQGLKIGEITTGSVAIEPLGDERAATRLTIPVSEGSSSIDARIDLIFIRVDRGIAILTLVGTLSAFDHTLAEKLARNVVDRLSAGLKQTASS